VFRRASLSNAGDRDNLLAHPEILDFDGAERLEACTRVAVADGVVIGFISVMPADRTGELEDLFVDPDWMRRGVATDLVRHESERARTAGIERIELTANLHALAFYERVGFGLVGEAETRFGPAARMHLELSRAAPGGG
jgi:predicted N-acetyltransferase YhbS